MSRATVWAYVCKECGHYMSQHRQMAPTSSLYQCGCGHLAPADAPTSVLDRRPSDETPYLPSAAGDQG